MRERRLYMKRPIVDPTELYTVAETCSLLGITRRTLNRYTQAGAIKCQQRIADRRIVYYGEDILRCYYTVE